MKAVFLDRDGVINQDSDLYIKSWEEFDFLPGSLDAIRLLTGEGFSVMVITNQSVIGRNMVPPATLADMHHRMRAAVEKAGGRILDIFFCPHTPADGCSCRKPAPGLLYEAAEKYGVDLSASTMVGDSAKDILAARNAGCGRAVLVQTGNGDKALKELEKQGKAPDFIARDLLAAAREIIRQNGRGG